MVHCVAGERGAHRRPDADGSSNDAERKVKPSAAAHDVGNNHRHQNPKYGGRYAVKRLDGDHDARIPNYKRTPCRQRRKAEDQ